MNKLHRYSFDPSNNTHLQRYMSFLETGTWGKESCPFKLEWPYASVPDMIQAKIVRHYVPQILNNKIS